MSRDYVKGKLREAVKALASGTGTIQERVYDAWLVSFTLRDDDFPQADLRTDFRRLHDALTKPKSGSVNTPRAQQEGTARVACEELEDDEAKKLAELILHLFAEL